MKMKIFLFGFFLLLQNQCFAADNQDDYECVKSSSKLLFEQMNIKAVLIQIMHQVSEETIRDIESTKRKKLSNKGIELIHKAAQQAFMETYPVVIEEISKIYASYYTCSDIKSLIAFYDTPIGKKSIALGPIMMQESMSAGARWGQQTFQPTYINYLKRLKNEI